MRHTLLLASLLVPLLLAPSILAACLWCPPREWDASWDQEGVWDRFPSNSTAGYDIQFTPNPGLQSLKTASKEPLEWEGRALRVAVQVSEADDVFVSVRPAFSNLEAVGKPDQAMLTRLVHHEFGVLGLGQAAIPEDAFYGSSDACS